MWTCPVCQVEVEDSVQQCPVCGYVRTQTTAKPETKPAPAAAKSTPAPDGKVIWPYSGKAFRARFIFYGLLTILLVALGVYLTMIRQIGGYYVIWGMIGGILGVVWIWFFCVYWYKTTFIRYRLGEAHLYYDHGLFRRTIDTMELISIADLRMQQTLWDRLINGGVGTLEVFSVSDRTDETLKMVGLEDPQDVLEKIDNARRRLRGQGIVQM